MPGSPPPGVLLNGVDVRYTRELGVGDLDRAPDEGDAFGEELVAGPDPWLGGRPLFLEARIPPSAPPTAAPMAMMPTTSMMILHFF